MGAAVAIEEDCCLVGGLVGTAKLFEVAEDDDDEGGVAGF